MVSSVGVSSFWEIVTVRPASPGNLINELNERLWSTRSSLENSSTYTKGSVTRLQLKVWQM